MTMVVKLVEMTNDIVKELMAMTAMVMVVMMVVWW